MLKQRILKVERMTNTKWLNLFKVQYINSKDKVINWFFASRKKKPLIKDGGVDCVVIIPVIETPEGRKIVLVKEYRVTLNDYEYGFPAGLVEPNQTLVDAATKELKEETGLDVKKFIGESNRIYSSPGLSDECSVIILMEVQGELSTKYQEQVEDIEPLMYDIEDVKKLLTSNKKVGAKTWGMLYHYTLIGRID